MTWDKSHFEEMSEFDCDNVLFYNMNVDWELKVLKRVDEKLKNDILKSNLKNAKCVVFKIINLH